MNEINKTYDKLELGKIASFAYYGFQDVRMKTMNRIRDIIRKKAENIPFDKTEEKKEKKDYTKKYKDSKLIDKWTKLESVGAISGEEYDFLLECWNSIKEAQNLENEYKKLMEKYVEGKPIYNIFLKKIRGMGKVLSTNLLVEFGDCSQYVYVSRLWAHTGYSVLPNGKAPRLQKGVEVNFNPKLRTMVWKVSDSLLKHNKGVYRQVYDTEKKKHLQRMNNSKCKYCGKTTEEHNSRKCEDGKEVTLNDFIMPERFNEDGTPPWSRGHAHNRALRKMVKIFLDHYWHCARELAGLPATKTYVEGVLKHDPDDIITWQEAIEVEMRVKEELAEKRRKKKEEKKKKKS